MPQAKIACTAPSSTVKAWLDAARNGQTGELETLLAEEPSLIQCHGVGLEQTALHCMPIHSCGASSQPACASSRVDHVCPMLVAAL